MSAIIIVLVLLLSFILSDCSDLYQSDGSNYLVAVLNSASNTINHHIEPHKSTTVIVTGVNKKKLKCIVPNKLNHEYGIPSYINHHVNSATPSTLDLSSVGDNLMDAMTNNNQQSIDSIIHDKLSTICLDRTIDYWTYQLCPFKHLIQYHKTSQHIIPTDTQFNLGTYNSQVEPQSHHTNKPYTQYYTSGDNKRRSTVQFVCDESLQNTQTTHVITSVRESQTFNYQITVHSQIVCDYATAQQKRDAVIDRTVVESDNDDVIDSDLSDVELAVQLLHPLIDSSDCLTLHNGWWQYYLCMGEDIIQAHREADPFDNNNIITTSEYTLGSWPDNIDEQYIIDHTNIVVNERTDTSYISQLYTNGTQCALSSNQPRQTELRMYCDKSAILPTIKSIDEISTCSYVMNVLCSSLCRHPKLKPHIPTLKHIVCTPYTS